MGVSSSSGTLWIVFWWSCDECNLEDLNAAGGETVKHSAVFDRTNRTRTVSLMNWIFERIMID